MDVDPGMVLMTRSKRDVACVGGVNSGTRPFEFPIELGNAVEVGGGGEPGGG